MPTLEEAIQKAAKNSKPSRSKDEQVGASARRFHPETQSLGHSVDDSPTSLFTPESVEQSALLGVQRLMNLWDSRIPELERTFARPEDYVSEANRLFDQYRGLRVKLDSAVAYTIGDTLNRCRQRFFEAGSLDGMTWTDFVKTQCKFSFRLAYDFMNIALRLVSLRGRPFSMDQFRAILQLLGKGFSIELLPENAESLTAKQLLELGRVNNNEDSKAPASPGMLVGWMTPLVGKMDSATTDLQQLVKDSKKSGKRLELSAKERSQLHSTREKLRTILSLLDSLDPIED